MPTDMVLFNYTEQGTRAIDRAAGRLDGLKKRLVELGGTVEAFYLTIGALRHGGDPDGRIRRPSPTCGSRPNWCGSTRSGVRRRMRSAPRRPPRPGPWLCRAGPNWLSTNREGAGILDAVHVQARH
jgi:hypothetical protein